MPFCVKLGIDSERRVVAVDLVRKARQRPYAAVDVLATRVGRDPGACVVGKTLAELSVGVVVLRINEGGGRRVPRKIVAIAPELSGLRRLLRCLPEAVSTDRQEGRSQESSVKLRDSSQMHS